MHRASYCNIYISRPTGCTNSYNESLLIIKCSTCFGLFSPSSGATFFEAVYRNWYKAVRVAVNKDTLQEFVHLVGLLIYTFDMSVRVMDLVAQRLLRRKGGSGQHGVHTAFG